MLQPTKNLLACSAIVFGIFAPIALALQNQALPGQPTLAVQVGYNRGPFLEMYLADHNSRSSNELPFDDFRRIPNWKAPSEISLPELILFRGRRESDAVTVDMLVQFDNDKTATAATYRLRENEVVDTKELTQFGIEPIKVRIVPAIRPPDDLPASLDPPPIVKNTKAVEVAGLEKDAESRRLYKLVLRNISPKSIVALNVYQPGPNNRGGSSTVAYGTRTHPLIKSGDLYETRVFVIGSGMRRTAEGFTPDPPRQKTLLVRTVMFEDGSYEGDAGQAARMEAQQTGRKIQLARAIILLQKTIETFNGDTATALEQLRENVYSLSKDVDPAVVAGVLAKYPSLSGDSRGELRKEVELGLRAVKQEMLREIAGFEEALSSAEEVAFVEWFKGTRERVKNQL